MRFKVGDKLTYKPFASWLDNEHPAIKRLVKNHFIIVTMIDGSFIVDETGQAWTTDELILYKRKNLKIKLP